MNLDIRRTGGSTGFMHGGVVSGHHELFKVDEDNISLKDQGSLASLLNSSVTAQVGGDDQSMASIVSGDGTTTGKSVCSIIGGEEPEAVTAAEVDFYRNPSILSRLILFQKFDNATRRLKQFPNEASIWVCAKRKVKPNPFHNLLKRGMRGKSNTPLKQSEQPYSLRQLPIHIACACLAFTLDSISRSDLELLILRLATAYPEGCGQVDHEEKLPLHEAILNNANPQTISMLLMACPKTIHRSDKHGNTPLELNENRMGDNKKEIADLLKLGVRFWEDSRDEANLRLKHNVIPTTDMSITSTSVMATSLAGKETIVTTDSVNIDSAPVPYYDPFRQKFAPMEPEEISPTAWEQLENRALVLERLLTEMYQKNYQLSHAVNELEQTKKDLLRQLHGKANHSSVSSMISSPDEYSETLEDESSDERKIRPMPLRRISTGSRNTSKMHDEEKNIIENAVQGAIQELNRIRTAQVGQLEKLDTVVVNFYDDTDDEAEVRTMNEASTISDVSATTRSAPRRRFIGRNVSDLTASTLARSSMHSMQSLRSSGYSSSGFDVASAYGFEGTSWHTMGSMTSSAIAVVPRDIEDESEDESESGVSLALDSLVPADQKPQPMALTDQQFQNVIDQTDDLSEIFHIMAAEQSQDTLQYSTNNLVFDDEEIETDDLSEIFSVVAKKYDQARRGTKRRPPSPHNSDEVDRREEGKEEEQGGGDDNDEDDDIADDISGIFHAEAERLKGGVKSGGGADAQQQQQGVLDRWSSGVATPAKKKRQQGGGGDIAIPSLLQHNDDDGDESDYDGGGEEEIELPALLPPMHSNYPESTHSDSVSGSEMSQSQPPTLLPVDPDTIEDDYETDMDDLTADDSMMYMGRRGSF